MTKTNKEAEEVASVLRKRLSREGSVRGGGPISIDGWKRSCYVIKNL